MAAPAWTATDGSGNLAYKWAEQPAGTALRLSLLRIHISEVSAALSTGNYSNTKGSRDKDAFQKELADLRKIEQSEAAAAATLTGRGTSFTRAKVLPS